MAANQTPIAETHVPHGMLLSELVQKSAPHLIGDPNLVVLLNGHDVVGQMAQIRLCERDRVVIGLLPAGHGKSKSVGSIIIGVVMVVAAFYTGGSSLTGYSAMMASMGASLVLSGASALLIKPPSLNNQAQGNASTSNTPVIGGQSNAAKPYGAVPKLYGRHRIFPPLAANPLIDNVGTSSEIAAIYDLGLGNIEFDPDSIRIGETLASTFAPEIVTHIDTKDIKPKLATSSVHYDQLSFVPQKDTPATFTTKANSFEAVMDIAFPGGLFYVDQAGNQNGTPVEFIIEWSPSGRGRWTQVTTGQIRGARVLPPGSSLPWPASNWNKLAIETFTGKGIIVYDKFTQPAVMSVRIPFPTAGQYDIRVTRTTPVWSGEQFKIPGTVSGEDTFIPYNSASITLIKSKMAGAMFNLRHNHTMVEMRLIASDKLSGVVQNMSVVATSVLPQYDDAGAVVATTATRNPAWCVIDALTGESNPRPVRHAQIDWPAWKHLADVCDAKREWKMRQDDGTIVTVEDSRYYCDTVIDSVTTVREVVDSLLSMCRANLVITATGKYSVALDEEKTIPRQLITIDNSHSFSGTRTFAEPIHALRVGFSDQTQDWQKMEVVVYADGYGALADPSKGIKAATHFEQLPTVAITDAHHAWAYGRYMLGQTVYRAETFRVTMDIEHMAFQRGDLVYHAHDVPRVGGKATRIQHVAGNVVFVAQAFETTPTGYTVRSSIDGAIRQGRVTGTSGGGLVLDDATSLRPDDLIVLGEVDRVTAPYLVQSIEPGDNMSATIALAVYNPALYQVDIGEMPAWNPNFGDSTAGNPASLKVVNLTATPKTIYVNRVPVYRVALTWGIDGLGYSSADIYATDAAGARARIGSLSSGGTTYDWTVDLVNDFQYIGANTIEVIPNSAAGFTGTPAKVGVTLALDSVGPAAPTQFHAAESSGSTALTWVSPKDEDIDHYEIRRLISGAGPAWDTAVRVATPAFDATSASVHEVGHDYIIAAFDTSGNRGAFAYTNPGGWGVNWGNSWSH